MSRTATGALQDLLERHVANGTAPGIVASLGTAAETEIAAAGLMAVGGAPMRDDAIFRIQSMTKAITAVAALRLVEAGRLTLDEPVERWLPELADRRVLRSPTGDLADTSAAARPITLRHLLTNTSGYGMILTDCPLQRAMADNGTEAGVEPLTLGADEWLARLASLPLAFQPGEGWRYHHSFAILGILVARVVGRALQDHLADDLLGPLGLDETGLWVPEDRLARLPAAYRHSDAGLVELEPAGGGFYAGPPPFDVSHGELVSTIRRLHPVRPDAGRRRAVRGPPDRLSGAPAADDQRPGAGDRQGTRRLLPGLLGLDGLGLRGRCRHGGPDRPAASGGPAVSARRSSSTLTARSACC